MSFHKLFRNGKQCRERWYNHLNPELKRGPWTVEEELLLLAAAIEHNKRWTTVRKHVKGRTQNDVKNHWARLVKREKLLTTVFKHLPRKEREIAIAKRVITQLKAQIRYKKQRKATAAAAALGQ